MSRIPLTEALPWSSSLMNHHQPRTFLICDSIETDGRFLLYTLAAQILVGNNNNNKILWLSGGSLTPIQINASLKKMKHDLAATGYQQQQQQQQQSRSSSSGKQQETKYSKQQQQVSITSMTQLLSNYYLLSTTNNNNNNNNEIIEPSDENVTTKKDDNDNYLDLNDFLKTEIWDKIVKPFAYSSSSSNNNKKWIILDDVSTFALMVGEELIYPFIYNIICFAKQHNIGVAIRCSGTLDQQQQQQQETNNNNETTFLSRIGAGGSRNIINNNNIMIPWERSLFEIADGIVDVEPLSSGYSREAHGRLVFTTVPGNRGWGSNNNHLESSLSSSTNMQGSSSAALSSLSSLVLNYCITDQGVRAIRLRA